MTHDPTGARPAALAFLKSHRTGVLATLGNGMPRARLVYYTGDDAFNVYFVTLANTRKAAELAANPHAAFVVAEESVPQTIQLEGTITDLTETATIDDTIATLVDTLMSNTAYNAPLTRFDPAVVRFYRLTPSWIRWGDFTSGYGSSAVFSEITP